MGESKTTSGVQKKKRLTKAQRQKREVLVISLSLLGTIALLATVLFLMPPVSPDLGFEAEEKDEPLKPPANEYDELVPAEPLSKATEPLAHEDSDATAQEIISQTEAITSITYQEDDPAGSGPAESEDPIPVSSTTSDDPNEFSFGNLPRHSGDVSIPIAIIIDDVGYNRRQIENFSPVEGPLTYAVLPQVEYTNWAAQWVAQRAQGLMLHQPMESHSGAELGPGGMYSSMDDGELLSLLRNNLDALPGVVAFNNHMGSKGTEDPRLTRIMAQVAAEKKLLLVDSRTSAKTTMDESAAALEVPLLERDTFLDNEDSFDFISSQFALGLQGAIERGYGIFIGHIWSDVLPVYLAQVEDRLTELGFELVTIDQLAKRVGSL